MLHSYMYRLLAPIVFASLALMNVVPTSAAATGVSWNVAAGAGTVDGAVSGMAFYPSTITIDVGDSVTWTFRGDAHTVTFLSGAPAPSPLSPQAAQPAGGSTYDGTGIVSSGIVPPVPGHNTYTLTFTASGTYAYRCLLHPGMFGTVIVQPAGASYPTNQSQYDEIGAISSQRDLAGGISAMTTTMSTTSKNADGSTDHTVNTGTSAGRASVMRFLPGVMTITAGDTVTWTNPDMMDPHTVTFAPDGKYPEFPSAQALTPAGGPTYDGTTFTNSGLIMPLGTPAISGIPTRTSYTLKFTKPGTYTYHCLIHDANGMIGKIVVLPSASTSAEPALVVTSSNPHLGQVLTDAHGRTLYFLTSELDGAPTQCTGACLAHWTPLSVATPTTDAVEGPGLTAVLSVKTRPDGINQVSYGVAPLYTFAGDTSPGDVKGAGIHAFGGVWVPAQPTSLPLITPLVTTQSNGSSASFVVSFASSAAGNGEVLFGPGPGCNALVEAATEDLSAGTVVHTIQVKGNDLPGTVGDNGIQAGSTYSFELVTQTANGVETDNNGGNCYTVTIPDTK